MYLIRLLTLIKNSNHDCICRGHLYPTTEMRIHADCTHSDIIKLRCIEKLPSCNTYPTGNLVATILLLWCSFNLLFTSLYRVHQNMNIPQLSVALHGQLQWLLLCSHAAHFLYMDVLPSVYVTECMNPSTYVGQACNYSLCFTWSVEKPKRQLYKYRAIISLIHTHTHLMFKM